MNTTTLTRLAGALALATLPAQAADVTIRVSNIDGEGGMVHWALFDSAAGFAGEVPPVTAARSRVDGESFTVTVHGLAAGQYAVRLFHDANGNGELDRNMLGIPSEGYGFSNGAGSRGPADFDDAAVTVEGDTDIEVRVR